MTAEQKAEMQNNHVKELFAEIGELNRQIALLEEALKDKRNELSFMIPDNEVIANVKHSAFQSSSVSYSKYVDYLLGLIPKTKRQEAELKKEYFTKTSTQHRFTEQAIEEAR